MPRYSLPTIHSALPPLREKEVPVNYSLGLASLQEPEVLTVLVVNSGGLSFTSVTVMMAVAVFERP